MAEDSGEKTEQATEKRMKEVVEKGQLSRSQDMTAWLGVGAAALMLPTTIARGAQSGTEQVLAIGTVAANPNPELAVRILSDALGSVLTTLGPLLGMVALAVLVGSVAQGGFRIAKLRGKYEQFNLVTGLIRVFGAQALWNGVKALLKTAVVGLVLFWVIQGLMPVLMTSGGLPVATLLDAAGDGAAAMMRWA
ncbi:MAG TPA: EscU/YscU/HrcU family type III secretion system export apparatus switch protein, partial [Gemmatimonadales bacterium]|nr:EscU/YscU/HrcU family type III secretion system export apparatus switch protein [Gemmatimonadales bacterium]